MKVLKNILMLIGLICVISTMVFAVQTDSEWTKNATLVPQDDPEIMERVDREFLVNTYWQSNAILLIKRANQYFPIIEPILEKNGIPDDFKYLAVAESGLQNVRSHAGASGFWQIMKATGKEYGLEVNANVDERYHIIKSTEVACRYLNKWKDKFGSWTLAASSYNAGPGAIRKYLGSQQVDNYYDLLLGQETGRYVFRILAIKEILKTPEKYGFYLEQSDLYQPVQTTQVEVNKPILNFTDFAKTHEINYKILKRHNPWLRQPHLNNKSGKTYVIDIPEKGVYRTE